MSEIKNKILLLIGVIFLILSIGRFGIQISIIVWPFCFLFYLHNNQSRKLSSLIKVIFCLLIGNLPRWLGFTNLNLTWDFITGSYFCLLNSIPFIIDTIYYNKIPKWVSIFIFPLSVSSVEFLFSYIRISNSNLYAYSQLDNTVILQIISVFGTFFLSFIIALFATILDYSIHFYKKEKKITKFSYFYLIIILLIYLYGGIYLLIPNNEHTIKAVSVTGMSQCNRPNKEKIIRQDNEYLSYIEATMKKANSINADLIVYGELAFHIKEDSFFSIVEKVKALSKKYKLHSLLALDVIYKDNSNKNKALIIDDEGKLLYDYSKHILIPVYEKEYTPGKEELQIIETKIGRISTVICYDINFPMFINSLSRKHLDLLIIPSWDYPPVAEVQSKEARYKAIEGGFNLIKNTVRGITVASDYNGRFLTYRRTTKCEDYFVVSEVNNVGIKTIYSYISFIFNYVYIVSLIILIIIGKYSDNKNKEKKVHEN